MKIRYGFVSNSSSSSFTCDVCGNTESGMDASPSDFDMSQCKKGHIFCNSENTGNPELTFEEKRDILINNIRPYFKGADRQAKIDAFKAMTDAEVETEFDEENREDGCFSCYCPICSLKVIKSSDRTSYLLKLSGKTQKEIDAEIKEKFTSYDTFKAYINSPKPTV
jgi:hypothetical protein